jgi:hypothetical protein
MRKFIHSRAEGFDEGQLKRKFKRGRLKKGGRGWLHIE